MQDLNLRPHHRCLHYYHRYHCSHFHHPGSINYYYLATTRLLVTPKTLAVITALVTTTLTITTIPIAVPAAMLVIDLIRRQEEVVAPLEKQALAGFELKLKWSIGVLVPHPRTLILIRS